MIVKVRVKKGNGPIEAMPEGLLVYTSVKRERNRANHDILRQLAEYYHKGPTEIKLLRGQTSSNKIFLVDD